MANLDKFLQMLDSSKADTRYDACEELRIANESNEQVIVALEKALNDPNSDVAEAASKALRAVAHQQMLIELGRPMPKSETEFQREEEARALSDIVMVTTPSIENSRINEYLGIVSAEVVLGTGFLSEFSAGISDLLGTRADSFQTKLRNAKEAAMYELRLRAYELNANAILGVDLDYSVLSNNMLMVVANGTAVRIEQI